MVKQSSGLFLLLWMVKITLTSHCACALRLGQRSKAQIRCGQQVKTYFGRSRILTLVAAICTVPIYVTSPCDELMYTLSLTVSIHTAYLNTHTCTCRPTTLQPDLLMVWPTAHWDLVEVCTVLWLCPLLWVLRCWQTHCRALLWPLWQAWSENEVWCTHTHVCNVMYSRYTCRFIIMDELFKLCVCCKSLFKVYAWSSPRSWWRVVYHIPFLSYPISWDCLWCQPPAVSSIPSHHWYMYMHVHVHGSPLVPVVIDHIFSSWGSWLGHSHIVQRSYRYCYTNPVDNNMILLSE